MNESIITANEKQKNQLQKLFEDFMNILMFRVLYFLFSCATPQFTLLFFLVLGFLFVLWSFVRLVCAWFSFFCLGISHIQSYLK